ncbi:hypothetical protein TEA_013797 [Camellia sinensis var. sinensis]|uniref:Uncharacterized protein n=1 Tax=Camellia sinensis var. sinensis TaxID=542762 RepID=A0A4S4E0S5_CAMSN|nr:hypothetical protein TEA_013797 [Camellia sinensis var. sinensis]
MKSPLKNPPLLNSDALALSLYVNGNEANEDQPTPLKMYDPNSSAEKSVRRSPRCTTNKYKSPKFEPALSNCLRRSPQFSAPTDDREVNLMKSDLNLIEWQGSDAGEVGVKWLRSRMVPMRLDGSALSIESPSKKAKTSSARSGLRKSPRLRANVDVKCNLLALPVSSSSVKQFSKKTKTNWGKSDSNVFGKRCSRSQKVPVLLVDEHGETKSKSVVKRKLKEKSKSAFGSCDLGVLGKKCLRSRTIPFRLVGIEDVESKRVLIELPGGKAIRMYLLKEKSKSAFGSCDLGVLGKKCLRSRTIPFRLVGIEDVESKRVLIELPEVLRDKKQQEEIKTNSGCFDLDGIAEKKCLRSKKVPICVVGTEKEDTKPGLIALPVSLGDEKQEEEIKTASGSYDFDGIVEKCLRSRKVAFRVVGTENEDTKPALIALPDVSAEKKPSSMKKEKNQKTTCSFFGQPVPEEEARERWRWRYELKVHIHF